MQSTSRFCEQCGKPLDPADRFCQECGWSASGVPSIEPAATPAFEPPPPPAFEPPPPPAFEPPPPPAFDPSPLLPAAPARARGGCGRIGLGLATLLLLGISGFFFSPVGKKLRTRLAKDIPAIDLPVLLGNPQTPVIPPVTPDPSSDTSASDAEAQRWIDQGYAKEQAGDLIGAIGDFQRALKICGNSAIADHIRQLQASLDQPPPAPAPTPEPAASVLYKTGNIDAVANGATVPNRFSSSKPLLITRIMTYHWNNGQGRAPGLISLQHEDGTEYGPWQAVGGAGQGGVPNASWIVTPDVVIKPGTYTLLDSHPATWSQNSGTGGKGMCELQGVPQN